VSEKKIGRNDPCPCGSGKKYKRCCLQNEWKQRVVPPSVLDKIRKQQKQEVIRRQQYGLVRPIIHTDFKDLKVVAVGSRFYWSKKWKTFLDFLLGFVKNELGPDWGNSELAKPLKDRHEILKWYYRVCCFQKLQKKDENGLYSVVPNGIFLAYLSLAYDLYTIRHNATVKDEIIKRLKDTKLFQGARYELFVAATCIRAGYDIEYENEEDGTIKHAEFIATHKSTRKKVSVEAKSKHRPGILGFPGKRIPDEKMRLNIGKLLNKALEKKTNLPLVIFIDANLPPVKAKKTLCFPPSRAITKMLDNSRKLFKGKELFDLVILTNTPYHYGKDDRPCPEKDILTFFPQNPNLNQKDMNILLALHEASLKYGNIPNDFPSDFDS